MANQSRLAAWSLFALAAGASAQQVECATVFGPGERQALAAIERSGVLRAPAPDVPVVIGLTFHVVRTSAGTGGLPQSRLDQALIDANLGFAAAGIQYCQAGPTRYINSDQYYDITGTEYDALRLIDVVSGTINCYFVRSAPFCGISSFTTSSIQGIVYNNDCVALPTNRSTFPHEIGHYFNLYHTHETAFGTECTNGSNCGTAGDLVCDTAADPNVLGQISPACLWTGGAAPLCGGLAYNPPVRNFMSYSNKECRDHFTAQQNTRALAVLNSLRPELNRNLCGGTCYPNCDGSTATPLLTIADFGCFLNRFAAGDAYANCDGSTAAPILTVADFGCFLNAYAAGCP